VDGRTPAQGTPGTSGGGEDAGTRYSENVRWRKGRRHKVLWEHLMEMRTPTQGTLGTSDEDEQIGSSMLESGGVFVEMFVDGVVY
jgi:hypothetical protein